MRFPSTDGPLCRAGQGTGTPPSAPSAAEGRTVRAVRDASASRVPHLSLQMCKHAHKQTKKKYISLPYADIKCLFLNFKLLKMCICLSHTLIYKTAVLYVSY